MTKQELITIIKEELTIVLEKKKKKAGTESSKESSLRDWFGRKGEKGKKKEKKEKEKVFWKERCLLSQSKKPL